MFKGSGELESVIGDYRDQENRWIYRLRDKPTIAYIGSQDSVKNCS